MCWETGGHSLAAGEKLLTLKSLQKLETKTVESFKLSVLQDDQS